MNEQNPRRIVLELQPGQPINGHIHGPEETPEPFHGWLELLTKLERHHDNVDKPSKTRPPIEDSEQPSPPDQNRP